MPAAAGEMFFPFGTHFQVVLSHAEVCSGRAGIAGTTKLWLGTVGVDGMLEPMLPFLPPWLSLTLKECRTETGDAVRSGREGETGRTETFGALSLKLLGEDLAIKRRGLALPRLANNTS